MISADELERVAKKMVESGTSARLESGEPAIPVSLSTTEVFSIKSRDERRKILQQRFRSLLEGVIGKGLEIDLNSISISGQTVEGKVSLQAIRTILEHLKNKNLEIYPVLKRQIQ